MRWFLRYSIWALLAVLLVFCFVVAFAPIPMPSLAGGAKTYPESIPPPRFSISEETTVLTDPLGPDGYVNYVVATNQQYGEGVTPENNAVIPLLEALGFQYIRSVSQDRYLELLGTSPPVPLGEVFVSFKKMADDFEKEHKKAHLQGLESASRRVLFETEKSVVSALGGSENPQMVIRQALHQAQNRPWSAEEFPEIADWLAQNHESLDRIVQACNRTRYFAPLLGASPHDENSPFISVFLGVTQGVSEAAEALQARALLRNEEGQIAEAWQDLLALHRLSRLVGQEPTLMSLIKSYDLEQKTLNVTAYLISSHRFQPEHAKRMLTDSRSLAPITQIDRLLHKTERYSVLDSIGWMAREATVPEHGIANRLTHPFISAMIDWDIPFKGANDWFDVLEKAAALPTCAERAAALEQYESDVIAMGEKSSRSPSIASALFSGRSPRAEFSRVLGQRICARMLPAAPGCHLAETRALATARLTLIAAAMAVFRAEHNQWPETLNELVPNYVEELPDDPFADAPFHYQRNEAGFVLYSVGPNLADDQGAVPGVDANESPCLEQDGDDVCLRVESL
jgi:hypothetical protein